MMDFLSKMMDVVLEMMSFALTIDGRIREDELSS